MRSKICDLKPGFAISSFKQCRISDTTNIVKARRWRLWWLLGLELDCPSTRMSDLLDFNWKILDKEAHSENYLNLNLNRNITVYKSKLFCCVVQVSDSFRCSYPAQVSAHIDCHVSKMVSEEKNSNGIDLAKLFNTLISLGISTEQNLGTVSAKFIVHVTYSIEYTMTQHFQRIRTGWVEVGAGHNGLSYF